MSNSASDIMQFERGTVITGENLAHLVGIEKSFPDLNYASTEMRKPVRSNRTVRCRWVKNDSGGTLAPKNCVKYDTDAGDFGKNIGAVCSEDDPPCGVVDEFIVGTVADGDYFWIVIDGPTTVEDSGDTSLAIGDKLSTDDAGRVHKMTGTETVKEILSAVGLCETVSDGTAGNDVIVNFRSVFAG